MSMSSQWALYRTRALFALLLAFCAMNASITWAASAAGDETRSQGWVVVPVEDYRALRAKAYPVEPDPDPPPVSATLTRVDYDLQVTSDVARGRATLTVDVLKDGWVRVPVPAGLLVREARLDGKLVALTLGTPGKGSGHLAAVLSHTGRSLLVLDVALPISASAGSESLALPSTDSGITRAAVQLPRQGVDIRVSGGLMAEKSESAGGSKWVAYAKGNEPLTFLWRRKTEDHRSSQPLRMRGALTQLVGLGEDSTAIYAETSLEVLQGAASAVRVQLPEKVTVNQVLGAMVADWEVKGAELTVMFLEPVEQAARFVINAEARLPREGPIDVPLLRLLGTERDNGGVAVEVLGAGEIKGSKSQGLEDADATDLGEMVAARQSPSLAAFRFRPGDGKARSLNVDVARYTQQAVLMANVEEARYQVLVSNEGKVLVQARYAVRNNQRNFVKISLPQGSTVWSASLSGKPVRPGQAPDGSLLLPLEKARGGDEASAFPIEITYLGRAGAWEDKGKVKIGLPALDLPISRTGLLFYYSPLFRVTAEPGQFRTTQYAQPISSALAPPPPPPPPAAPAQAREFDRLEQFAKLQGPKKQKDEEATQALVDKFRRKSDTGRVAGILPLGVSFPAFGPSIFLVSELTGENQAPSADFTYQREKKGGAR